MYQFIHDHYHKRDRYVYQAKKDRKTFCFELPDYDLVETEIVKSIIETQYVPLITMKVGIAQCHPKDNYVKAIGRETSMSKLEPLDFVIKSIKMWPDENEVGITIYNIDKDLYIRMVLRKSHDNLRILAAYIEYEK